MEIREIIPIPEDLLSLEVEELAGVLLMHLNTGGGVTCPVFLYQS
jgi:hypothetical protein